MFKNALISVSDKSHLAEFLKFFAEKSLRIVSTGGTADHLKQQGFKVVDVSEQTGFPEVMGGRVKTLHPRVHMATLARPQNAEDEALLKKEGLQAFDLLICNLYPFSEAFKKGLSEEQMIEKIDVGGPTMLRAAAKNFERICVLVDPADYSWVLEKIKSTGILSRQDRKVLAAKVFTHTAAYDSLIGKYLGGSERQYTLAGEKVSHLRYGENPQQQADWYANMGETKGLHVAKIIQGKELSYNNLLDLHAAASLVQTFNGAAAVAVKHNNPCGVAQDKNLKTALEKAIAADPVSVFGGIIACNQQVGIAEAEILGKIFLECVIAPSFSPEALSFLAAKKNLRLLHWPEMAQVLYPQEIKSILGGFLVQQTDSYGSDEREWKFLGETPSAEQLQDLQFAEKVCSALKSNAIAIVKSGQTVGLGMGQVNRVDAVEQAIGRMKLHFSQLKGGILASDAFFPFPDSIEKAADAGIQWILQPGGSMKDAEVFAAAKKRGLNLVITGQRHFRH